MPSDDHTAALVSRVKRGEAEAFEELAREYLRPAYSVALAIVRRPADAEDVAQDSLLRAFERIDSCRKPERFKAWLMQIVRNQSRNWLAKRSHREPPGQVELRLVADHEPPPEEVAMQRELLGALELLGEPQREIVLLHDLSGWTHAEIGAALGLSETMSRQHLFKARRRLRAALEGEAAQGES